ncbi:TetR/AcrR family transcriptional regulator [Brevibacillus humidisoli]|uniref:TetR/AcrR family transcriptional regulator n=1 Tax=Brevibacillus humidisoli TaxID=2895522 RepID=UPI001E586386|nr:TetR/AcrR family transcriptional regulator [Brevibacillus humidisoli]UFJ39827.1 TetR/AcrR family transcriptional regulator [Brevibacillus humidisoli]
MHERILAGAIELIQQNGIKFTMADLAAQLGMSKRTLYEHFSSKEELIGTIIDRSLTEMKEQEALIAADPRLDPIEKLRVLLCLTPEEFRLGGLRLLHDVKRHLPGQWQKIDHFLREEWATICSVIEEGIASGQIRPINLPVFIQMYVGCLQQLIDQRFLATQSLNLSEALEEMASIMLSGITADHTTKEGSS